MTVVRHAPSGQWTVDLNNAAQMARVYVASEEVIASHPIRGLQCISTGDFAAAEYWLNETAEAAWNARLVPSAFRDAALTKRFKKLRNPQTRDYWGIGFGMGSADETLEVVYRDAASTHAKLVLDHSQLFEINESLEESVARHYWDSLDRPGGDPATDEGFILALRAKRFALAEPLSQQSLVHLKAMGITPAQAIELSRKDYYDTAMRMATLAERQNRTYLMAELRIPGAGEPACTSPNPTPRAPIGWFPDPEGHQDFRYFDGRQWTDQVSTHGRTFQDPRNISHLNRYA